MLAPSPPPPAAMLAAARLDHLRAAALRATMGIPLLRRLYCRRALRLGSLYLLFVLGALVFSTFLPLWQLLLGPIVFGYAHLGATARYVHYGAAGPNPDLHPPEARRIFALVGMSAAVYALIRILSPSSLSEWEGSMPVDGLFMLAVLGGAAWIYRASPPRLLGGLALILPLTLCLWRWPLGTTGILILAHNVVGFIYWIHACRDRADRGVAWAALGLFALVNVVIFAGALDAVYALVARHVSLPTAGLTHEAMGKLLFPWSDDRDLLMRGIAAFAFGQSVHYFVWMKAIPDQHHRLEMPTSFRQSLKLLGEDFGPRVALTLVYGVAASMALWVVLDLKVAREAYFLIAGFHGYVEIAALPLLGVAARGARIQGPRSRPARPPSIG